MRFGKRAGFQDDLNEFKILRSVRAPMRFGKRSEKFKKAPMRFGKRAPMRFGKRDYEGPSYINEDNFPTKQKPLMIIKKLITLICPYLKKYTCATKFI